ncbi:hypothetical protein HPB51_011269 [Rhipicephalus microplus]|uniref:Secreted protein n=1 Tax=Rhipicephalus microplus TaxID=6941 RepID=A0A9J6DME6_RHIMP|nr:hypothetical protein HPB51_011269 [Rhipicephalus microplus]
MFFPVGFALFSFLRNSSHLALLHARPPYQTERFGETRKGAYANACAAENSGGRSFSACQTELGAFYSLYFIRASQQDAEATVKRSRGSGRKRAEEELPGRSQPPIDSSHAQTTAGLYLASDEGGPSSTATEGAAIIAAVAAEEAARLICHKSTIVAAFAWGASEILSSS